jgi:hypothetical protein
MPGDDAEEKWLFASGRLLQSLVWIRKRKWFVCFGIRGNPVQIPGLRKVKVKDYWGNDQNA